MIIEEMAITIAEYELDKLCNTNKKIIVEENLVSYPR